MRKPSTNQQTIKRLRLLYEAVDLNNVNPNKITEMIEAGRWIVAMEQYFHHNGGVGPKRKSQLDKENQKDTA